MVSVQIRNSGEGTWRVMTLPGSVQAAQTLAGAARTLNLADQVKVSQSPTPVPNLDIRV